MIFGGLFSHIQYNPPVATSSDPVACTMEAKLCPDGSYVGRTGPNCEFTACPTGGTPATTTVISPAHPIKPIKPVTPPVTTTNDVSITSISPASGQAGTSVTLTGHFTATGNIVHFGPGGIGNLSATAAGNGMQSITFTVPTSIGPYCRPGMACPMYMMLVTNGVYKISVENDNGISNSVDFSVIGNAVLQ